MERALNRYANRSWSQAMADWAMTPIAAVCVPIVLATILAGIPAWRGWLRLLGRIGPRADLPNARSAAARAAETRKPHAAGSIR
jgi:hypothetical protein